MAALFADSPTPISRVDVYVAPETYVLVGHQGRYRRLLHVQRRSVADEVAANAGDAVPARPPVEEEETLHTEASFGDWLHMFGGDAAPTCILQASALLGMVRFLEGWYLLLVTRHEPVERDRNESKEGARALAAARMKARMKARLPDRMLLAEDGEP